MVGRSSEISPQTYARVGGFLYLVIIVAALFGEAFVRGTLIVDADPAATASRILGSETLFRVGLAGEMLTCVCDVAVALVLFVLLEPVSRNLSLLAAFFRLTFVGIYGVAKLFEVAALVVLGHADYLKAFDLHQLQVLAYLSLRIHGLGYGLSLIFFGSSCVLQGYLIYQSGYLPRLLGTLLVIAGLGYLIDSFAQILAPAFAAHLFPWILLPGIPAEWGLCLWLIVKGINLQKWDQRVEATGNGGPWLTPNVL